MHSHLPSAGNFYEPVAMRQFPWLSSGLVLLAHTAFGGFLQNRHSPQILWGLAIVYVLLQAAILSIAWKPVRNFLLLGFKSDVGYTIMALVAASLAVVMVAWIQIFAYFFMILAATLLLRIDLLIRGMGNGVAFIALFLFSIAGLGSGRWLIWLLVEGHINEVLRTL
jgi:hypothetical protein